MPGMHMNDSLFSLCNFGRDFRCTWGKENTYSLCIVEPTLMRPSVSRLGDLQLRESYRSASLSQKTQETRHFLLFPLLSCTNACYTS